MKKIYSALIAVCALSFSGFAQQNQSADVNQQRSRNQNRDRINPRLLEQLQLTAAQKERIRVINDDYRAKMQDVIKADMTPEQRRDKREALNAEKYTNTISVLTTEQVTKLKDLQSKDPATYTEGDRKEKIKIEDGKTK